MFPGKKEVVLRLNGLGLVLEVGLPLTGLGLAVGLAGLGLRLGLWLGEADGVPLWLAVTDGDGVGPGIGEGRTLGRGCERCNSRYETHKNSRILLKELFSPENNATTKKSDLTK